MKNRSLLWGLWTWVIAFSLTFGGIGALVTGYDFTDISLQSIALWCAGISLLWLLLFQLSESRWMAWGILGALGIILLVFHFLGNSLFLKTVDSFEVLLNKISDYCNMAYGWGKLQWSETLPETTIDFALRFLAIPTSLSTVWAISRKKGTAWAILPPMLPFFACLIVTNTVPDIGCLLLLAAGVFQLVITGNLRRRMELQGKRLVAMSLIPVLLASCLLFWAVPQGSYKPMYSGASGFLQNWFQGLPMWDQIGGEQGMESGNSVNLGELGDRNLSQRTVLKVIATVPGTLYLREQSYDSYDGLRWQTSQYSSGIDTGWGTEGHWETVKVETIYTLSNRFLPGNPGPEILELPFELGKIPNQRKNRSYSYQWQIEGSGGVLSEEMRQQCLALPTNTAAQAYQLVQNILGGRTDYSDEKIARIIADYVRNSAQYSLTPQTMPQGEKDFALWFLTEAEQGYCVHFATAATVLLRAAGIPARYVTGYVTEVSDQHTTRVYQKQSHAWVEYFREGKGWTILDATPSYELPEPTEPTQGSFVPNTKPTTPSTQGSMPTEGSAVMPTQGTQSGTQPTEKPTESPETKADFTPLLWLLGLIALLGGIWAQYRLRLGYSRRQLARGDANQQALARWRAILYRSRILGGRPPRELKQLAEKAKFSQHTLTPEEVACFDEYIREQSRRLSEKTLPVKWLLRLFWAME